MKQVIFNVGGALSVYTEFDGKKLLVDIGSSSEFNPITDFLLPLYENRESEKYEDGRYLIDQLVISHPHKDHMSAIVEFNKNFYPDLLTCPNDNEGMKEGELLNWELVGKEKEVHIIELRQMLEERRPPLRTASDQNEFIFYLPPEEVEQDETLMKESYINNVSLAVFLIINQHRVFLPGDLQKEGMKAILDKYHLLRNKLKGGVDVLVAPHHGLKSSYCQEMFDLMKDTKTKCLNVISEKPNNPDEPRDIDSRYSGQGNCSGVNNLSIRNSVRYQYKTSNGHLFIDYSDQREPIFKIIKDNEELINCFL